MKKRFLGILIILIFGIGFLAILYYNSSANSNSKNGFTRTLLREKLVLKYSTFEVKKPYTISTIDSNHFTLFNYRKPYELLTLQGDLSNFKTSYLTNLLDAEKFEGMNSFTNYNNSAIIVSGKTSTAYLFNSLHKTLIKSKIDDFPFYHSEMINPNSFVIMTKVVDKGHPSRKLKKVNWQGKELRSFYPGKNEGYFSNDGKFRYDKSSNSIIYMYYYKGGFTALDTNLNVIYNANTVDTVRYSKIQLKTSPKTVDGNIVTTHTVQSTPPKIVNKRFCIANGNIYINSNLRADNEKSTSFLYKEAIDVYSLKDGKYKVSFHLPKLGRQKLTGFIINGNKLLTIFNTTIAVFEIPKDYL